MTYQIIFSETAQHLIQNAAPDLRVGFKRKLEQIKKMPTVGKPLLKRLSGYYSLRTRQLRIIYKILSERKILEVHYLGPRRDIYELVYQLKNGSN